MRVCCAQVVLGKDHLERDCTLPVANCGNKFMVLPDNAALDNKVYETLHDMIMDPNMPTKVQDGCVWMYCVQILHCRCSYLDAYG